MYPDCGSLFFCSLHKLIDKLSYFIWKLKTRMNINSRRYLNERKKKKVELIWIYRMKQERYKTEYLSHIRIISLLTEEKEKKSDEPNICASLLVRSVCGQPPNYSGPVKRCKWVTNPETKKCRWKKGRQNSRISNHNLCCIYSHLFVQLKQRMQSVWRIRF